MTLNDLFHCPNCNAALEYSGNGAAIVRCDYCHSAIIVPESLRRTARQAPEQKAEPKSPPKPAKPPLSEEEAAAKVTALARNGETVEAMKLYREMYPVGLREAKAAIDATASGLPLVIPDVRWEDEEDLPLAAAEEITRLVTEGKTAEAAHLYRVTFGTSHTEANAAVEQLKEGKSIDIARFTARKESQATAVRRERTQDSSSDSSRLSGMGGLVVLIIIIVILVVIGLIVAQ
ncbi:MAG: hypothetical protein WAM60_03785 [Candidatus Promineifilaceae bacterium]